MYEYYSLYAYMVEYWFWGTSCSKVYSYVVRVFVLLSFPTCVYGLTIVMKIWGEIISFPCAYLFDSFLEKKLWQIFFDRSKSHTIEIRNTRDHANNKQQCHHNHRWSVNPQRVIPTKHGRMAKITKFSRDTILTIEDTTILRHLFKHNRRN